MSNLLPETWRHTLERAHDKVGQFLGKLNPWHKEDPAPERITADILPAFMQSGGPSVEMCETDDGLIVRLEVPGLHEDDCRVELVGRRLTVTGEKQVRREHTGDEGILLSECRYGRFTRTILLPYDCTDGAVSADLSHGVLTVRLPRPEQARHGRYRVPVS